MRILSGITILLFFFCAQTTHSAPSSGSAIVSGTLEVLDIVDRSVQTHPLNYQDLKFISDRLYLDKLADHLNCEIKVSEIKQEKKFSTGVKIIEMLEIRYRSTHYRQDEHKIFFPIGSPLTKQTKNSQYAGTVEEFKLEANDLYNTQFIFQHDGRGRIIWINYISDLHTLPCGVK